MIKQDQIIIENMLDQISVLLKCKPGMRKTVKTGRVTLNVNDVYQVLKSMDTIKQVVQTYINRDNNQIEELTTKSAPDTLTTSADSSIDRTPLTYSVGTFNINPIK